MFFRHALADALASWYNGSYEDEKKNEESKGQQRVAGWRYSL